MNWICAKCRSSNEETSDKCFICGEERSDFVEETRSEYCERDAEYSTGEAKQGKVFFSDFDALVDSLHNLINTITSLFASGTSERVEESSERVEESSERAEESSERAEESSRASEETPKYDFAEPWPEHKIKFDIPSIKSKGYVGLEKKEAGSIKGYCFFKPDGSNRFIRVEMVLIQKMAHKV